jgi:ABC-type transport system substrate-binding protein
VIREGVDPSIAVDRIENEGWDGITSMVGNPLLAPQGSLSERYPGDGGGAHRYIAVPMANTEYVALNASRPIFSDPRVRRAAAHALNRSALAAVWGEVPADDVLPPNMPGYRAEDAYEDTPDVAAAKATMRGPGGTATMAVYADCPECRQFGESVKAALGPIGIDVKIVEVEDVPGAIRRPVAKFDLFDGWTFLDYPDPASFLTKMLGEDVPASWLPASVREDVGRLSGLTGAERTAAAADLAAKLQATDVPIAPVGWWPTGELLSSRLGCQVFPPFGFGVDLAALCLNEG